MTIARTATGTPTGTPTRTPVRKSALAIAAALALGAAPTEQVLAASCTWNPVSGNWSVAANWSCGLVPTGGPDDASIAGGKVVTVNTAQSVRNLTNSGGVNIDAFLLTLSGAGSTINTGTINIGAGAIPNNAALQVSGGHNINNTGGVINISADSVLNQFGSTISGGTINSTGTGRLVAFNSNSNFLSGVTLNGVLDLASGTGIERVTGGLVLNGAANVNNNSVLSFNGDQTLGGTGSIVLGNTGGSNRALSMEGSMVLTIGSGITVRGENGTVGGAYLAGGNQSLVNNGRISADVAGGSISLTPSNGVTNFGVLEAINGGTLVLNSAVAGQVGSSIHSGAGSTVLQNGVTLSGVINTTGGGAFRAANSNSNFLTGVTLNGVLDLASATSVERVFGGLTLNGTVNINNNSVLSFNGDQTLGGTGSLVLGNTGGSNRALGMEGSMVLTIGSGITVRGENGTIGQGYLAGGNQSLVNNGRISADVAGGSFSLTPSNGVTNFGVLEAINGATLVLNSNITGMPGGSINAGAGSTVLQNGVTLSGTVNSAGSGNFRVSNSNSNFLQGATVNGPLDMATGTGVERVSSGLVLNGTININNNSVLSFNGDQTLSGTGSLVLGNTGASNRALGMEGSMVLTIGSGITVRGENGTIGQAYLTGGNQSLVNNGLISADVNGGSISLAPSNGITNSGVIEAQNGGTLVLNGNVMGMPGGSIVAGAGSTVLQNGVSLSGTINSSGTGNFRVSNSNSNFLQSATVNGPLDLASGTSIERVSGGLVLNGTININNNSVLSFNGDQTLSGSGNIVLGNTGASNRALSMEGSMTLTVGSGITVGGENGTVGQAYLVGGNQILANDGSILANVGGGTIALAAGLTQNTALLGAANGGTLRLDGAVTQTGAGQINAATGSTVIQNGVTITGGAINSSGTGRMVASNSNSNFLSAVSLGGLLDLASGTGIERVVNGLTLNGGTINVNANSALSFNGDQTLGGTGSIVLGSTGGSNRALGMEGSMTLTVGAGVTVRGINGTLGQAYLVGGTQNLVNNGTINSDGGGTLTVTPSALTNNGLLRAQNGILTIQSPLSGTGTLQVDSLGVMNLANGGKTQGTLVMGAAGSVLNLGSGNLTLSNDYTNAAAGSGNSFNRRAGVNGAGLVVAGADAAQAITGTGVTNGATTNATLTLGNVRVGATNFGYQVANTGTTGPSLRGAIQTNVNGANLTDARLSGAGVTASNYLTGAPGNNTGNLGVTFTVATAGVLAPLAGQVLNLRSNFENLADQKLNIVLGAGAAAFNAAQGSATSPVQVANQRTGGSNTATLQVTNTATAGAFSEDLNAAVGGTTGGISSTGGIAGRLAGANSGGGNISVRVNTATAGAKTGTVTLDYQTAGTVNGVSNGLGVAAINPSSNVTVNGNVYLAAQASPSLLSTPINLGNFHTTASAQAAPGIVISNTNVAPVGFQEGLAAAIISTSGQATGTGFANALAGGSGTLNVGLSSINAGLNTGTVGVQLRSNGTTTTGANGLGNLDIGGLQTLTVNANGYRLAVPNTIAAVNFGNVLANSVQTRTLTVSNGATADGFSEALNAAFGSLGGTNAASFSTAGAISGLLAGNTNTTSMVVTLNTSSTGAKTASVQVLLDSNGTAIGNGLGLTALAPQTINLDGLITGVVGNLASAGLSPTSVNFGKFREGAANQTQQLTVSNLTVGPGEGLNASFGASSGGASHNGGSIASLATSGVNSTSMSVTLGGLATAGAKTGSQVLNFASDGSFNNGTPTGLPSQTVNLSAEVYRLATAAVNTPINLAARRVGDAAATSALTLSNSAATDGFSEGLRGAIGAAPAGFGISGAASTALIAAGASEARTVSLSTAVAGSFGGNVTIGLVSNGAGTSGFGDAALTDKLVALSGKVYTQAAGQVSTPVIDFGIVRVGDVVSTRNITINNSAAVTALNDTLRGDLSGISGPFGGGSSVSGVAAQGSGQIGVTLNTGAAGVYAQNGSVSFLSQNPDMLDVSAGANGGVLVKAQVNRLANADFDLLAGLGLLTQNGNDYILDLGNLALSGNAYALALQLDNEVSGPADDLSGGFDLSAVDEFGLTGFGAPVGPLGAGQATGSLGVAFLASTLGLHEDIVSFDGFSTNASDPNGIAQHRRLIIRANVIDPNGNPIPEPGSLGLLLIAAVGLAVARRQRQQRSRRAQ